jgi:eukaryotic-like serine/threonine-protein kinase
MAANTVECPQCHSDNPSTVARCLKCNTPFGFDAMTMTASSSANSSGGAKGWSIPSDPAAEFGSTLAPGTVLGIRYEIVQLLGQGGMGAVYKAKDLELDRLVALKVIRPEMAANPEILRRFKQELILARQITHRNVIRIFDLGEADGIKFITMEYIEGQDLKSHVAEKNKLSVEESVRIVEQVCLALEAAHAEGVVHRDLKPQNIMMDKQGKAAVMDFGIARSVESGGMTQTGMLMGTPDYMSPEQVMGQHVDARSDLFTLGVIFYELLTASAPYRADTTQAAMYKRLQDVPRPAAEVDPNVPRLLSDIVTKCLQIDPALRYQSAREILQDLEAWRGGAKGSIAIPIAPRRPVVSAPLSFLDWFKDSRKWLVPALAAVIALGAFLVIKKPGFHSAAKPSAPAMSLAILPFRNASGDASLDWLGASLANMLSTDVGESARLRTVSQDRLLQVLSDLRITPNAPIDPATLRQLAEFSKADTLVTGQYARFGSQIRIDATVQDLKRDTTVPITIEGVDEKDIPRAVDRLAESIRQKLALPGNVLKELKASSFQPDSSSEEALRDYNQGISFQRDGKYQEAQNQLEAATKADPNFALAFARLAQTDSSLGYDSEAEQSAQTATTLSQGLPDAEKYLIAAIRSQVAKNYPEAIKAYANLTKVSPDNSDVQSALAGLYKDSGNLTKAREYYQKILSANPKDSTATLELGRLALKSGDPQGSFDPLNRAYSLSILAGNDEEQATSLHLMAVAYGMLGKPEEDLRNEQQAVAIWRRVGEKRGLAFSLNEMAAAQASLGKPKDALASYQEALNLRREIGDKGGLGDSLIDFGSFDDDRGDHDEALKMYKEALQLERNLGNEGLQALCLNNIGTAYANKGQFEDALTYYQQALQLREKSNVQADIVDAVHNLGEASAAMGQYGQAISYYLRALDLRRSMDDRRGAAIESYGLATLFDYQGRFGAAVNSMQESLKTFRDIKDKTPWMAKMLDGYGEALILAGRGDEAKSYLDEALSLSRELKTDNMVAEALGFQGDALFYRGDFKSAQALYLQALEAAVRSKEPDTILLAKVDLAKLHIQEKSAPETISSLRQMIQQADEIGLKYTSVECSIFVAEAMMQNRDYSHAQQELQNTLLLSDQLGTQPLSARAHYLLGKMEQVSGNSNDARDNYREALGLLDTMKKDPGAEKLLQRADFKAIYDESTSGAKTGKS